MWDFEHTWSLVTLSFLLQNVETVIRVTSDQCPVIGGLKRVYLIELVGGGFHFE